MSQTPKAQQPHHAVAEAMPSMITDAMAQYSALSKQSRYADADDPKAAKAHEDAARSALAHLKELLKMQEALSAQITAEIAQEANAAQDAKDVKDQATKAGEEVAALKARLMQGSTIRIGL